MTAKNDYEI